MGHAALADRLARVRWSEVEESLAERPYARLPGLLEPGECQRLIDLYADEKRFRRRIDMERHRFGRGE